MAHPVLRPAVPDRRRFLTLSGAGLMALPLGARAATEPTLTVGGLVAGSPAERRFSVSGLEALGTSQVSTRTPWYQNVCRFSGVPMSRLSAEVGARGTIARVTALNDYVADVPVIDFAEFRPILATRRDGELMPVTDKGPFFIVYPFDDLDRLKHQTFYSRSVWQVARIDFV